MPEKNFDFSMLKNYKDLKIALSQNKNCSAFGMGFSQKILSAINFSDKVFYVAPDQESAKKVYEEYKSILGEGVGFLPAGPDLMVYRKAQSNEANVHRIKTIFGLLKKQFRVVVAPADALLGLLPNIDRFKAAITKLRVNDKFEIATLRECFVDMGYVASPLVSDVGQFSIRGDIVDIYPVNADAPYRIEFFDNIIESIKIFETETQRSAESKRDCEICPYTNLLIDQNTTKTIINTLQKMTTKSLGSRESDERFSLIVSEVIQKIENRELSFCLDFLFPIIAQELSSIFDYIPRDFLVVIDECKMVYDSLKTAGTDILARKEDLKNSGQSLPTKNTGYLSSSDVLKFLGNYTKLAHQKLTNANKIFDPDAVSSFRFAPVIKYSDNFGEFVSDIANWIVDGYKVFICAGDTKNAERLARKLESGDVYIKIDAAATLRDSSSAILPRFLSNGFVLPDEKIVVVGTYDIFPKKSKQIQVKKRAAFSTPEIGSFVVHRVHGIGKCEGVTQLTGSFGIKDFIVVSYHGGDKLYVPIDQMDQLDRYTSGEPKRLSKIGGVEFSGVKERVKKQIKEMAFSLLKLYAERETKQGVVYNRDEELQHEFESKFPFVETEDQLAAIRDVKNDMEAGRVMDRLVCGDVGFGKTEVALRSAFKAVVNGKQVAFVAPTTILARQHFNTCKERMAEFGVRVAVLDRFVTAKETKEILKNLSEHKIDIICGTHKLLNKDVVFEDLGLLILDEEQKFGVEHKEKIKQSQKNIDVLTLSATPIPRTLHMALSGIRDISVISTPPTNRTPTQNYVTEYSDELAKSVIERELSRGGQVFVVYNRVETIYAFSEHIRSLVPNARIVVGHGQLSGNELEDVIYKFYNHMADVLICTTIIENGIDLPNANSLIVVDSDKLGLSQLYQIRGRVGRGNKAGFAYFTYKPEKVLTEDGYKRLEAISEFTEFGSGFKVAMRDLEIRGSGNVFGAEQHGHIEKVGYELYSKMLMDAIKELKGGKVEAENDTLFKLNLDAFIPDDYIKESYERMSVYKNISLIQSLDERENTKKELLDRFGALPESVENLVDIAYLKSLTKVLGVEEVFMNESMAKLTFSDQNKLIQSKQIHYALEKFKNLAVLNLTNLATIVLKNASHNPRQNFLKLIEFVELSSSKK